VQSFSISDRGKAKPRKSNDDYQHCDAGKFLDIEARLRRCGTRLIAGVDEAGRGPLAGPVVASAVILSPDSIPPGIRDSKKLTARRRLDLFGRIRRSAISIGVGIVSARAIDRVNILEATKWAMIEAVQSLKIPCDGVLVDGRALPEMAVPVIGLIKGDDRCVSVAAASIIAKVTRDRLMVTMDGLYPRYRFRSHKGYGTPAHMEALRRYGPSRIHRFSFEPVSSAFGGCGR
jgi:ribonuclease HII